MVPQQPDTMHITVRDYLIDVASTSKTTTYSALSMHCQFGLDLTLAHDRAEIGCILGDISSEEYNEGHPF